MHVLSKLGNKTHLLSKTRSLKECFLKAFSVATAPATAPSPDQIVVEIKPFKVHKTEQVDNVVTTTKQELMEMFQEMFKMRRMEIAADQMYKKKLIRGFCHLYDGQEAICVGMERAITKNDSIITSYRDHCQYIGRGGSVKEVMAELFGRSDGCSKGIGGSMHMYDRNQNFYGGCGIVGAQIPLGAGLAFAHKYRQDGGVAVTMYGDGAANQGQKYEALNMAALWSLPAIFVCENNQYGMGTSVMRAAFETSFYKRGDYVPGIKGDGMDALAVKRAFEFCKKYVLENGPIVLELDTYRYHGHSMSDPGSTYRTRDEIQRQRKERDPLESIRNVLKHNNLVEDGELKKIENKVIKEVDDAVRAAGESPIPPNDWLYKNIYCNPDGMMIRGVHSEAQNEAIYDPTYRQ